MSYVVRHQILPLEKSVFQDYKLTTIHADWFEAEMLAEVDEYGCAYMPFQKQETSIEEDIKLVLFAFGGRLVAMGILVDVDEPEEGFTGQYVFNAASVVTFKPVTFEEFKRCIPTIQPFGTKAQTFEPEGLDAFFELVRERLVNIRSEDFAPQEWIRLQLEAMNAG